jgi:16S rRNA G966 N2-methylase RsmD
MKRDSFEKAKAVVEKAKAGDESAISSIKKLNEGTITINKAFTDIKKQEKIEERRKQHEIVARTYVESKDIQIHIGDCLELTKSLVEPNSVDLILTDPPYPYENIDCWSNLSELGNYALKEGGLCIAMSGQLHLPEVMERMSKHLTYYWTMAVKLIGKTAIIRSVNLINSWKPFVVYQKGKRSKMNYVVTDYLESPKADDKIEHEWQQNLEVFEKLVERFSEPGQLILEPFACTGTTLVACRNLKRKCIGFELENKHLETIKSRLA